MTFSPRKIDIRPASVETLPFEVVLPGKDLQLVQCVRPLTGEAARTWTAVMRTESGQWLGQGTSPQEAIQSAWNGSEQDREDRRNLSARASQSSPGEAAGRRARAN